MLQLINLITKTFCCLLKKLKEANQKSLKGEGNVEVDSPDFESNLTKNSSSYSNNSDSSNKEQSSQKNEHKYKGSNEYSVNKSDKEVNGKKISDDSVQNARKLINKAGVYADSMSDQDVRNTIKAANKKKVFLSKNMLKHF
ncbi:hypothetical protein [Apilactobacillus ozensis]|uniref:hypothetical protein n=1 Tax=Apilactobacillus ozensis TaxID=866801 RepID=UPI0006D01569|nr:hypothetical protein [Apilactobacillus ozensis]